MKSFIIILIFLSFCGEALNAQTYTKVSNVKTPNNSIVQDTWKLTSSDIVYTPAQIAALAADLNSNYNGAELVEAPSYKYNCHAYAWHVSEGGDKVWMGRYTDDAEDIYWTDDSYIEVPEKIATKVSYHRDGNHSAIRLNSNLYESKWGWGGPLVKHGPNDVFSIYQPAKTKKYYVRKPSLSGPKNICGQETYTYTINLPNNIPISWNISSDIRIVSEQNNSVTVERNPNTYYMYTDSYIVADVGEPYNSSYERDDIITWKQGSIRTTDLIDISSSPNDYGQPYRYTAQLKGDLLYRLPRAPEWSVSAGLNLEFNDGTMIQFTSNSLEGEYIMVKLTNPCGEQLLIEHVLGNQGGYYSSFSLSPNPATDVVTVQLNEAALQTSQGLGKAGRIALSGVCEIQLWSATSMLRSYKTDRRVFEIPVSELPAGIYFVRIIDKDGKIYTEKLIKK